MASVSSLSGHQMITTLEKEGWPRSMIPDELKRFPRAFLSWARPGIFQRSSWKRLVGHFCWPTERPWRPHRRFHHRNSFIFFQEESDGPCCSRLLCWPSLVPAGTLLEEKKDSCGRRSIPWAQAFRAHNKVPMESLSGFCLLKRPDKGISVITSWGH